MTPGSHEACAAFGGIDWADTTHDVCLQAAGAAKRACFILEHTPEAIDVWVSTLRTRFNGQPIAVCLALNKGPLVSALRTYDFLVLFPLHPLTLARSREACTPSRATDDPTDAALQLALLLTHRAKLQPLQPQSPTMRALDQRVAHRRRVVADTVRRTNRLPSTLKHSFPQGLQWFQDKDTPIFCDFLRRWPTRKAVQLARRSTLDTCCRDHHVRSADVMAQRLHAIKAALPLTTDAGVIAPQALLVQTLVNQLRVTLEAIETFANAIAQCAHHPPACPLVQALPGAGPVFAPRRLVACGAQRERSAAAAARQKDAGIAPVTARSGKQSWGHWRFQCPKCRRPTCVEWAAASMRPAFWARVSSQQQRDQGKAHQAAVRALAFTWIRILLRCWQERTPYEESVSLKALNSHGSSLLHNLAKAS
jgi:Transposase/Transposase IS116/IS110/IS902 family